MPSNDKQKWHGADQSDNDDLTVRHSGPHFQAIRSWAEQNNVSDIFDAIALAFGFTENFTIIGNLYRELSNPDSVWRQLSCPVRDNYDGRLGGLTFYSFQPA